LAYISIIIVYYLFDSEGISHRGHQGTAMLENRRLIINSIDYITIGIQEVLTVKGDIQTLTVAILDAKVEKRLCLQIIIILHDIGLVQLTANIGCMAIDLEFVTGSLKEFVSTKKAHGEMRNARYDFLYTIIVVILTTNGMTIVKVEPA
jgi:hypothetical protein